MCPKKGLLTFKRLLLPLELTLSQKQGGKFQIRAEADVSNQYHYFSDTQLGYLSLKLMQCAVPNILGRKH